MKRSQEISTEEGRDTKRRRLAVDREGLFSFPGSAVTLLHQIPPDLYAMIASYHRALRVQGKYS